MKKYIYYLILFLFLLLPSNVFAIVSPTSNFYINDYANILSQETEEYILNKSVALNNADGTQIVVVTVPNLDGYSLEEYANELFNSWGIGNSEKDNGLLLLLALEEREFRVEVGDGLGGILPDGKTGRFQDDYIIPYLKNDDWDNGIKNGYDAFYSEIVKLNNLQLDYNSPTSNYEYANNDIEALFVFLPIFSSILIGLISGLVIKSIKNKVSRDRKTTIYLIVWFIAMMVGIFISSIMFTILFINIFAFALARFSDGSSTGSSGGFRSGRSYRSSSSRSFSGGGGRSSGGGSSRRF